MVSHKCVPKYNSLFTYRREQSSPPLFCVSETMWATLILALAALSWATTIPKVVCGNYFCCWPTVSPVKYNHLRENAVMPDNCSDLERQVLQPSSSTKPDSDFVATMTVYCLARGKTISFTREITSRTHWPASDEDVRHERHRILARYANVKHFRDLLQWRNFTREKVDARPRIMLIKHFMWFI